MKLYVVDKYNELKKIANEFEDEIVEIKNDCKFKMTKNDYLIACEDMEGLEKLKNIIFLAKQKDYKYIWNIANNYKTIDIVDYNLPIDFIVNRIKNKIKELG